jgi:hypothetical protein
MRSHTPRRLLLILSPLVLYPYATPAGGGEVRVSFSYDDHRRELDGCETKLVQICGEVASARASLDQALANQSAAASSLAAANSQMQTSARCIADAQGRIDLINQSLSILRDRAASARAGYEAARTRGDAAAAEVIHYQNTARATFESSPAYSQVARDLALAKDAHDREVDGTLAALRGTNDYADLYDQVEELEAAVQFERNRNPVDQASLSAASVAWMNAKSAFERFKADQVNHDSLVVQARERVNAIEQARQELVTRFSNDLAVDVNLKNLIAASTAAQQDAQVQVSAVNTPAADVTAREQAIANLQATISAETARLAQAQSDAAAWQSALNQYAADAANADSWLRTLWVREATCRRERDCAAENLRICLAERDSHQSRDRDRDHDYRRSDSSRDGYVRDRDGKSRDPRDSRDSHDRDEKDRQRREDAVASAERVEREALAARHLRDRAEEQRLAQLPPRERQKAEQQATEERRRRELERQRTESIASAAPLPRTARPISDLGLPLNQKPPLVGHPLDTNSATARSEAQRQQVKDAEARDVSAPAGAALPLAGPVPAASAIVATDSSPAEKTERAPRSNPSNPPIPKSVSTDRHPPDASQAAPGQTRAQRERDRQQVEAKPRSEEVEKRESQSNTASKKREAAASDEPSHPQKESAAKADHDRQQRDAQARAEQDRQQKESQSRAERERQDRDARSHAEEDQRRQRESQAKSDENRRAHDAQAKSEQDRQQREAQAKSDQDRKSDEKSRQSDGRAEDSDRGRDKPRSGHTR